MVNDYGSVEAYKLYIGMNDRENAQHQLPI